MRTAEYNPNNILNFLMSNNRFSVQHLNTLRSSIASVFNQIHENEVPIAERLIIRQFFTAKRKAEVKIPAKHNLETWDLSILVNYVPNKYCPTTGLSLGNLQQRTLLLLCMATMWRPRSDIGRLQCRDITFTNDNNSVNNKLVGMVIHSREPKEHK
jgi:hypothetical protein